MSEKPTYEELEQKINRLEKERSELKGLEAQSRYAVRRSQLSNEYAKALIREKSERALSIKICQIITEKGGYGFAWIAFSESDKAKSIRPITQVGFEYGYLEAIKMSWADPAFGDYPTSAAIHTGSAQCMSIRDQDAPLIWRKKAAQSGYEASLALPLSIDRQVFGALTICASETDRFDEQTILFWEGLADDLAFAYERLRKEMRQRKTEQSLRKSEERETLAQQAAKMGTWAWDIRTGGLDWSKQIYPLFGVSPDNFDATYEAFLQCIPPEDRAEVEASVHAAVYEGKTYDIEHPVRCPDGTLRWMSERANVFKDESGNPIRMVGVVQDITERKQALEKTKILSGMMPICSNCKQIRDKEGRWHQIETYVRNHSNARFSHSICPECAEKLYPDYDLNM